MVSKKPDMEHSVLSVSDLLATSSTTALRVPDYQRSYAWTTRQCKDLWNDLQEFTFGDENTDETFFLGAIVLVINGKDLEILDGQQRLTTITILLTCLTRFLRAEGEARYADAVYDDFVAKEVRGGPEIMYKLVLNRLDESYFRDLVQDHSDPSKSNVKSHKNIRSCKRFFDRCLLAWQRDYGDGAIQRAKTFTDTLLDRVFAVTITASNLSSAGYVFERLNDRGIGLTTVDLVRSLVMQRCGERYKKTVLNSWGDIYSTPWPGDVDDLLRYHWVTRFGDATGDKLYTLIRNNFKQKVKGFDPLTFTRDVREAAKVYNGIFSSSEGPDPFSSICAKVVELRAKSVIPLLMKVSGFSDWHREALAKAAFTAFVRNRLIADQSSTSFEDMVYAIAQTVEDEEASFSQANSQLLNYTIDDDDCRLRFAQRSIGTQYQAAFLLRSIELYLRNLAGKDELRLGSARDVHVEHIQARNPANEARWPDHDDWINRIGNLTLWSGKRNSAAQNAPFEEKRERYGRSELLLTRELSEANHWDSEAIQARQQRLAEIAVKVWPKEG